MKKYLIGFILALFVISGGAIARNLAKSGFTSNSDANNWALVATVLETLLEGEAEVTSSAAELNVLDGVSVTASEIDNYTLSTCIVDISAAQSDWVVAPHAGDISAIYSVIDGALITGDADLTFEIAGVLVTNGIITVAFSGSAAGDVDSSTPTAANTVTAGQAIEVITDGASANVVEVCVTFLIDR